MNTFKNPFDPDNSQTKVLLKQWIIAKLGLSADTVVEILEHQCSDSACLHAETIFRIADVNTEGGGITRNSDDKLYKIAKPLVFIRKWDIDNIQPYPSSISKH